MGVTVKTILGTDTVSASRTTINDNFSSIKNEIDLIEDYIDVTAGTISGITQLNTAKVVIGGSAPNITVSTNAITITGNPVLSGNLSVNGNIYRKNLNTNTLNLDDLGVSTSVGSISSAPDKNIYRVGNTTGTPGTDFTINLFPGEAGQEIIFLYEDTYNGNVNIVAGGSAVIVGYTTFTISDGGHVIKLLSVANSLGNQEWYVTTYINSI